MKSSTQRLVALLTCAVIAPATAQVTIPQEYGKTIKTAEAVGALGSDLFGDQTNFYTGATTFTATDVSIPGNNSLPVSIGRRLVVASRDIEVDPGDGMFADWDLDIPHIRGVFPYYEGWQVENYSPSGGWGDTNNRCSAGGLREAVTTEGLTGGVWAGPDYWQGYTMYVPGAGDQDLLAVNTGTNPHIPQDGKTYRWVTAQEWYVSCLSTTANGYPGEGFLVVSPDGTRYTFNWFATRPASTITKAMGTGATLAAEGTSTDSSTEDSATSEADTTESTETVEMAPVAEGTVLQRVEVWALPTRVEDRFGNAVTYTYDVQHPWRLTKIESTDGRLLTIGYNTAGRISSVNAGSRTWTYVYGSALTEVHLPDESKWLLSVGSLRKARTLPEGNSTVKAYCQRAAGDLTQPVYAGTITHPSGAVGTFSFQSKVHGRSYVPKTCIKPDPYGPADHAKIPYLFDAVGLTQKTISGPGLPMATWTYAYSTPAPSWLEDCTATCVATKAVEVSGPADFTRYTFSTRYEHSEGKLLRVERGSGSASLLETVDTTYLADPTGQPYPAMIGRNPFERADNTAERHVPVIKRVTTRQGQVFKWEVSADCGTSTALCLDHRARPTKVIKSSEAAP